MKHLLFTLILLLTTITAGAQSRIQRPTQPSKPKQTTPAKPKAPKTQPSAPKPTTGTLSILSTPTDAAVKIENQYVGTTPLKLEKPAGTYIVSISAEGYETLSQPWEVKAGETITYTALLTKKQTAAPSIPSRNSSSSSYSGSGSPTDPTIQYLFTHPMIFLDGSDVALNRTQMENKLAQLHGSRWYIDKSENITYLRPNGTGPMLNGREIEYVYCSYWNDNYMRKFEINISDRKFSSYDEAKRWVSTLISQIRSMGFSVNESENKQYKNYYYKGENGNFEYEIMHPTDYFNQLYIRLYFNSSNAVTALSSTMSSSSYSGSSSSSYSSNNVSSTSSTISKFFPYFGIVFGETKVSDLSRLGYTKATNSNYYTNRIINVYDDNQDQYVDYIVTSEPDKLPDKWVSLGFDWGLSYNQYMNLMRRLGFSIEVTTAPHVEEFSNRNTLKADFKATSSDGQLTIKFSFEFGNAHGEGYTVDSRNSLEFMHIKYTGR